MLTSLIPSYLTSLVGALLSKLDIITRKQNIELNDLLFDVKHNFIKKSCTLCSL